MPKTDTLSITAEIDAITSGMRTDSEGMEAFRLAGGEAVRTIEEAGGIGQVDIGDVVVRAMNRPSESELIEKLKETRPDEFGIGVAISAYKAKVADRAADTKARREAV